MTDLFSQTHLPLCMAVYVCSKLLISSGVGCCAVAAIQRRPLWVEYHVRPSCLQPDNARWRFHRNNDQMPTKIIYL